MTGYIAGSTETYPTLNKGRLSLRTNSTSCLGLALFTLGWLATGSVNAQDQPSGPAWDGLVEVEGRGNTRVWVMPGVDTSTYTSIRLEGAGIHFRPVKRQHRSARAGEFPVTEANRERLREMAQEIFPEELAKTERFEVVDSDGPDTLIVKGALLDVISRVPPQQGGRSNTIVSVFGEATLAIELIDSDSGAVIVRAVERRAAQTPGSQMRDANSVTARAEARRLMRSWATRLRAVLDDLDEFLDSREPV
jgi:hypothetical protein